MSDKPDGAVLIVDDDRTTGEMLRTMLSRRYDASAVFDPEQAVEAMQHKDFAAVIVDHMMPKMTGVELMTWAAEAKPQAARILVTASHNVDELRDAVNLANVHGFISKPVRMVELQSVLDNAIRAVRAHAEVERLVGELKDKNLQLAGALEKVQASERSLEHQVAERTAELEAANARLSSLVVRDGLTGLYNHQYFQQFLEAEISRSRRHFHRLSLLFIDVDSFKNYNDNAGHPAGDELLKELAGLLTVTGRVEDVTIRGRVYDVAARYGGEEFVVVLPETPKSGASVRAERLRVCIQNHEFAHRAVQPQGRGTVSVGVACYPDDAETRETLIYAADQALLAAKRAGRNRVHEAPSLAEAGE